ncbi:hypothetical protein C5167_002964 [Papaver somniferum]|uniref:C2 domain-containing protein n=1 Tax=Papaver somniferum TaxID=3469 RepID=A0A4Y7L330_PAPSO|nr:elicitor-responsive protein 1-like [Papaver somniferum]RZC78771.1 hypothetical protein C5167_002964 [Papaver somniferum]
MSGLLEIVLVDAQGLPNSDLIGKMDPYVTIQYKNQNLRSSVAKEPDGQYNVAFKIFDRDTFSRDDLIGETSISMKDLVELGAKKGKTNVEPRKYSVFESKKNKPVQGRAGDIHVGLTFTPKIC